MGIIICFYCKTFEEKTKVKRTWVALALLGSLIIGLIVGFAAQIICNIVGFLYPAYSSNKKKLVQIIIVI